MNTQNITLCLTIGKRPQELRRTLESILSQINFEHIIAINDFRDEETNQVFRELCPHGTLIIQEKTQSQFMNDYMSFTSSYNSIIMLMLIPFFALITKLAFRKWGHNYYEHVVMNAYILSFYTIINISCS